MIAGLHFNDYQFTF